MTLVVSGARLAEVEVAEVGVECAPRSARQGVLWRGRAGCDINTRFLTRPERDRGGQAETRPRARSNQISRRKHATTPLSVTVRSCNGPLGRQLPTRTPPRVLDSKQPPHVPPVRTAPEIPAGLTALACLMPPGCRLPSRTSPSPLPHDAAGRWAERSGRGIRAEQLQIRASVCICSAAPAMAALRVSGCRFVGLSPPAAHAGLVEHSWAPPHWVLFPGPLTSSPAAPRPASK